MVPIDERLSYKIANMSLLCAGLVMTMHVIPPRWVTGWLNEGVCTMAVPYFFLVSGFFLVRGSGSWLEKVVRRVRTLLVPLFFWCAVGAIYLAALAFVANLHAGRPWGAHIRLNEVGYWFSALGLDPFAEPVHSPLWYVRALFVLILLSPLLRMLTRRFGWWCVGVAWVLSFAYGMRWIVSEGRWHMFFLRTIPLIGGTYFLSGMLIAERGFPQKAAALRLGVLPVGLIVLAIMAYRRLTGLPVMQAWSVVMIPCLMGSVWALMPSRRIAAASLSFPLYIVHWFFCVLFWWYAPGGLGWGAAWWPVRLTVVFAGSIVTVWMLRRFAPRFVAVVFGGR